MTQPTLNAFETAELARTLYERGIPVSILQRLVRNDGKPTHDHPIISCWGTPPDGVEWRISCWTRDNTIPGECRHRPYRYQLYTTRNGITDSVGFPEPDWRTKLLETLETDIVGQFWGWHPSDSQ